VIDFQHSPEFSFSVAGAVLYLVIGVGYVLTYAAGGWALRGHPLALSLLGTLGLILPAAAVCAIIAWRRRCWAGCQRLFWDTFAIGVALWVIGHLGWAFEAIVLSHASWLQWHTLFSLCGGIGPLIALLARPHIGARRESVGPAALVVGSYGLLAVFIYTYFVLVPSLLPGTTDAQAILLKVVQVHRAVLFGGMVAALVAARRTDWRTAYTWLAVGTGIGFFLRIVTSLAIMNGRYKTGTLYDLAWIAPFLCYAGAALSAPDSPRESARVDTGAATSQTVLAALPVFLIPVVGYGALYILPLGGAGDSFRALLTGLMTVAGLGVLTLRLAAQGGELARADVRMRLLAAATEQTGDLILITRVDGGFELANDAFVRALGYSRKELSGLAFGDLVERGSGSLAAHIQAEVRESGVWRGTLVRQRRDGSTFPAACTVVALKDSAGAITHFVGAERDIGHELKVRDQLVHSERLSAIGELVAGVAHEINNPLQTIIGSVELLLEDRPDTGSRHDLELVRLEAARAGQIVRNLLSFVRRSAPDRVTADLNDIIRSVVDLRGYHLQQRNITLTPELQTTPAPVLVNREEIQQVILNLILNAEQAMLSAGRGSTITIRSLSENGNHIVEVADDGPGVSGEMRGRIFEPFFTTKDVGQGTGLGLSISHGIASAHGGSLTLCPDSVGACFRLTLPAPAEADPHPIDEPKQAASRRVLVVDDEAPIRKLLARLLQRRGFEVLEADSAGAALAIADATDLALVLCDVRLPGANGMDLYRTILGRHPLLERSFVFITGDRSALDLDDAARKAPVLVKPFTAADLQDVLSTLGLEEVVA
jgi:PAS domain S-box-containing protein